ncbi:hypothetical protein GALMADRAFT_142456 [Galerina marginata CBS 339.88]|uniref:Uncharacterized protein n=1 Tax=Galerina marginata (strain CBS 339.88) TaxID=685588 RepID=A0A067T2U2_GALM3|nr:hypothetical protein GALMADRAFT_142456 [Galerina marginata CBS 339.88]
MSGDLDNFPQITGLPVYTSIDQSIHLFHLPSSDMPHHQKEDTIFRRVFVYPASGKEPYISSMKFSKAARKVGYGFETTVVDLRKIYGQHLLGIRYQLLSIDRKCIQAEDWPLDSLSRCHIYFNTDVKLPINKTMARIVGINIKRPGPTPAWRGDVVVAKRDLSPRYPEISLL